MEIYDLVAYNEDELLAYLDNLHMITIKKRIDKKYFNTEVRTQQYIIYQNTLSGDSYTVPWPSEGKNYCDFNTTKYIEMSEKL